VRVGRHSEYYIGETGSIGIAMAIIQQVGQIKVEMLTG
jgi:hypothetical protein